MSLLTDREIEDLYFTEVDNRIMSFANAIEAAVIKKLSGVSVEPVGEVSGNAWDAGILYRDCEPGEPLHTATQLAAARVQAIEEAEAAVRKAIGDCDLGWAAQKAIRALIGGKQ